MIRKILKRSHIYTGRIVSLDVELTEFGNGARAELEIVGHPGGAAAVALNADGKICLLRQYRPLFDEWLWELPAGKLDGGEEPLAAAQRELREEAGCTARRWDGLGRMIPSPGVFKEIVHLFLARDLQAVAADPEPQELFELHWVALDQALQWAVDGKITDAKTLSGLLRADAVLRG